jgi:opacity protein-like surface antigen
MSMRSVLFALTIGAVAISGVASAQTSSRSGSNEPGKGYVEGVAQAAFGNVTSQSYGAEIGVTVWQNVQVFVEGGMIRDVASAEIGTAAQKIAGFLTQSQTGAVSYSVKQPVTFGVAGIRNVVPVDSIVQPYIMAGFGMAKVKQDAKFSVGGTDATANLQSLGVTLGSDLSGTFTKPMLSIGGGVTWPVWQQIVVDFQFRYGQIFAEGQAINTTRAGLGLGVRF